MSQRWLSLTQPRPGAHSWISNCGQIVNYSDGLGFGPHALIWNQRRRQPHLATLTDSGPSHNFWKQSGTEHTNSLTHAALGEYIATNNIYNFNFISAIGDKTGWCDIPKTFNKPVGIPNKEHIMTLNSILRNLYSL